MAFSPTEAAFEGFRLTREKPLIVVWWTVVYLAVNLVVMALATAMLGSSMTDILAMSANPMNADPATLETVGPKLLLFEAAALPLLLLMSAVLAGAAYRAVLQPGETSRFGYLKLGADELRLALLYLVLTFIVIGAMMLVSIVVGVLLGIIVAVAGGGANGAVAGGLAMAAALTAMLGVLAYFGVRLSLAGPATFVEKKLTLRSAWVMTRGHFWPLLGAYFLSWVLAIVVTLLGKAVFTGIGAALGGGMGAYTAAGMPDFSSMASVFSPGHLLFLASTALLGALQGAITLAPAAVAFRALGGRTRADLFV